MKPITIILPFYKNPELVEAQLSNLDSIQDELCRLNISFIIINDSPNEDDLKSRINEFVHKLNSLSISVQMIENEGNLGFVKSTNKGLELCLQKANHALILNSDALITPNALSEMAQLIELEEKIGFVAPRSNNATLASIPWYLEGIDYDYELSYSLFKLVAPFLDRYQIVPTLPGFCLLIKHDVLKLVGLFDEIFSPGYNEENDLIMRANRIGFICVLANKAWVYHGSSKSFSEQAKVYERDHAVILKKRYPEYYPSIHRYLSSPTRTYERLITELVLSSHRPSLLLDLSCLKPFYNGTFELVKSLMNEIIQSEDFIEKFQVSIIGEPNSLAFHGLKELMYLFNSPNPFDFTNQAYSVMLSFAQPFNWIDTSRLWRLSSYQIVYFLDNIATDCLYIEQQNVRLKELWNFTAKYASSIAFLSNYSKENFYKRFERPNKKHDFVLMPSIDPTQYSFKVVGKKPSYVLFDEFILIIGNHYEHKLVNPATDHLALHFPNLNFIALGYRGDPPPNVLNLQAGNLPEEDIAWIYQHASVIVFPSYYEGFGFPLIRSLGCHKKVIAFSTEVVKELVGYLANSGWEKNIVLVDDFVQLKNALQKFISDRSDFCFGKEVNWKWRDTLGVLESKIIELSEDKELLFNAKETIQILSYLDGIIDTSRKSVRSTVQTLYNQIASRAKHHLIETIYSYKNGFKLKK